jgi:anthranilate synthase component 1
MIFSELSDRFEYSFLLESAKEPERSSRYILLGFEPHWVFKASEGGVIIEDRACEKIYAERTKDPLQFLKGLLQIGGALEGPAHFVGGAVGYISYDSTRYWEGIPQGGFKDPGFPDMEFAIYDDFIMFDRYNGKAFYCYLREDRSDELNDIIKLHGIGELSHSEPKRNMTYDEFEKIVMKAKEYIASGDIFQVVLSKRFEFRVDGDLLKFYTILREINPSPYMYFLKMSDRRIIGSSPEMLMKVEGKFVETFPIAGTRPRSSCPWEDQRLSRELMEDEKERAEHVMLVDLARNDIGKVSKFGSVRVLEFMKVHKYSRVQHIVSRVIGELREDKDSFDALKALFPAGTVSGAPKRRAMEIIEELEPIGRGPYAGAIGYFSYNGNADFAITIRTLLVEGNRCYVQAGAGIVADSDPKKEWFETEHKASALLEALELSSRSDPHEGFGHR